MSFLSLSRGGAAVAVAVVAAVIAIAAISGGAVAQDGGANASSDEQPETYQIAIDEHTRVVSSDWDGDTVTIVLEADRTTRVTITDASQEFDGAVDIKREHVTVPSGERIEVTFTIRGEQPRVTVGTSDGLVGLGDPDRGYNYFEGDPGWVDVRSAAIGGGLAALAVVALIAWALVARDPDEPAEVAA